MKNPIKDKGPNSKRIIRGGNENIKRQRHRERDYPGPLGIVARTRRTTVWSPYTKSRHRSEGTGFRVVRNKR